MSIHVESITVQDVLTSLGFADPLVAARQQAQMILLGRLASYEASVRTAFRFDSPDDPAALSGGRGLIDNMLHLPLASGGR